MSTRRPLDVSQGRGVRASGDPSDTPPIVATRDMRNASGNEDAARKLIYLAVNNAVPQWTRTRNWTMALIAFKIQFGDRLPD